MSELQKIEDKEIKSLEQVVICKPRLQEIAETESRYTLQRIFGYNPKPVYEPTR